MSEKVVLVIDKPESCEKCRFRFDTIYGASCMAKNHVFDTLLISAKIYKDNKIPCPLRPLPRKNQGRFFHSDFGENTYVCGWNACIEEIEK